MAFSPNTAPIRIAQRSASASQDTFEAQVGATIQQAINQYWSVVLARERLRLADALLKQAQATYDHDERALDLGALPPLDIYRSQSEVAASGIHPGRVPVKQQEDTFRSGQTLTPTLRLWTSTSCRILCRLSRCFPSMCPGRRLSPKSIAPNSRP